MQNSAAFVASWMEGLALKLKLRVISIKMELYIMTVNDVTNGTSVEEEKDLCM